MLEIKSTTVYYAKVNIVTTMITTIAIELPLFSRKLLPSNIDAVINTSNNPWFMFNTYV